MGDGYRDYDEDDDHWSGNCPTCGENEKLVIVEIRHEWGERRVYPRNPAATSFALISGTKTLTLSVCAEIEKLGYTIETETVSWRGSDQRLEELA
jgi:hypothetical protein